MTRSPIGSKTTRSSPLEQPAERQVRGRLTRIKKKRRFETESPEAIEEHRMHLHVDELKRFFKQLSGSVFWHSYFYIQYRFGCRLSEPALIVDDDVDVRKKRLTIRRLKNSSEVYGYKVHSCAADAHVLETLQRMQEWKEMKGLEDNPFIFASNRRRKIEAVGAERLSQLRNLDGWQAVSRFTANRVFRSVGRAIRLPSRLVDSQVLRHTRAVVMLAGMHTLEAVSKELGHSSVKVTERYSNLALSEAGSFPDPVLDEMGLSSKPA